MIVTLVDSYVKTLDTSQDAVQKSKHTDLNICLKVPKDHNRSAFHIQLLTSLYKATQAIPPDKCHQKTADLVEGFEMPKRSPSASGALQCYGFDLLH